MTEAIAVRTGTSAQALLSLLVANGIDRIFMVPGESFLDLLDALNDFPELDVVTCRHEGGAGFMACADGRLTRRPGVLMVSRGPGASNAAISLHTSQQDGIPLLVVIGHVACADIGRAAFQEIDYGRMFGAVAKWVFQVADPVQIPEVTLKALRLATSGAPGPVVIVLPEDVQKTQIPIPSWTTSPQVKAVPGADDLADMLALIRRAERPLLIAGGAFEAPGGREALLAFAESWGIPTAVALRRHDVFPNCHPLFLGHLGHGYPQPLLGELRRSDLILAIGTRLGDITTQGYSFPSIPVPEQTVVHCYPDTETIGWNYNPARSVVCDPISLLDVLAPRADEAPRPDTRAWASSLAGLFQHHNRWPDRQPTDGLEFGRVVRAVMEQAPPDLVLCVDGGAFTVPIYRFARYTPPQLLLGPLAGAMGYGVPAAIAAQLRLPHRKIVCMVGDGGFMMTGNEMILAVQRRLPIFFVLANNGSYGSIKVHQEQYYPGREVGTALVNPDFIALASSFGMHARRIDEPGEVDAAIREGLNAREPFFLEVRTSLEAILPHKT